MEKSLDDVLSSFISLSCTKAEISLGSGLRLVFDTHRLQPRYIAPFIGTWANGWRILINGTVLVGQFDIEDWEHGFEDALAQLCGQTLTAIELSGELADVRFVFGPHLSVEYFEQSHEEKAWECILPDGKLLDVGPRDYWRLSKPTDVDPFPLTAREERLLNHAEDFCNRWRDRLPVWTEDGNCSACAFWHMLHGHSYFWDLGVCTNRASSHDGQLVGVKSGCSRWTDDLPKRRS